MRVMSSFVCPTLLSESEWQRNSEARECGLCHKGLTVLSDGYCCRHCVMVLCDKCSRKCTLKGGREVIPSCCCSVPPSYSTFSTRVISNYNGTQNIESDSQEALLCTSPCRASLPSLDGNDYRSTSAIMFIPTSPTTGGHPSRSEEWFPSQARINLPEQSSTDKVERDDSGTFMWYPMEQRSPSPAPVNALVGDRWEDHVVPSSPFRNGSLPFQEDVPIGPVPHTGTGRNEKVMYERSHHFLKLGVWIPHSSTGVPPPGAQEIEYPTTRPHSTTSREEEQGEGWKRRQDEGTPPMREAGQEEGLEIKEEQFTYSAGGESEGEVDRSPSLAAEEEELSVSCSSLPMRKCSSQDRETVEMEARRTITMDKDDKEKKEEREKERKEAKKSWGRTSPDRLRGRWEGTSRVPPSPGSEAFSWYSSPCSRTAFSPVLPTIPTCAMHPIPVSQNHDGRDEALHGDVKDVSSIDRPLSLYRLNWNEHGQGPSALQHAMKGVGGAGKEKKEVEEEEEKRKGDDGALQGVVRTSYSYGGGEWCLLSRSSSHASPSSCIFPSFFKNYVFRPSSSSSFSASALPHTEKKNGAPFKVCDACFERVIASFSSIKREHSFPHFGATSVFAIPLSPSPSRPCSPPPQQVVLLLPSYSDTSSTSRCEESLGPIPAAATCASEIIPIQGPPVQPLRSSSLLSCSSLCSSSSSPSSRSHFSSFFFPSVFSQNSVSSVPSSTLWHTCSPFSTPVSPFCSNSLSFPLSIAPSMRSTLSGGIKKRQNTGVKRRIFLKKLNKDSSAFSLSAMRKFTDDKSAFFPSKDAFVSVQMPDSEGRAEVQEVPPRTPPPVRINDDNQSHKDHQPPSPLLSPYEVAHTTAQSTSEASPPRMFPPTPTTITETATTFPPSSLCNVGVANCHADKDDAEKSEKEKEKEASVKGSSACTIMYSIHPIIPPRSAAFPSPSCSSVSAEPLSLPSSCSASLSLPTTPLMLLPEEKISPRTEMKNAKRHGLHSALASPKVEIESSTMTENTSAEIMLSTSTTTIAGEAAGELCKENARLPFSLGVKGPTAPTTVTITSTTADGSAVPLTGMTSPPFSGCTGSNGGSSMAWTAASCPLSSCAESSSSSFFRSAPLLPYSRPPPVPPRAGGQTSRTFSTPSSCCCCSSSSYSPSPPSFVKALSSSPFSSCCCSRTPSQLTLSRPSSTSITTSPQTPLQTPSALPPLPPSPIPLEERADDQERYSYAHRVRVRPEVLARQANKDCCITVFLIDERKERRPEKSTSTIPKQNKKKSTVPLHECRHCTMAPDVSQMPAHLENSHPPPPPPFTHHPQPSSISFRSSSLSFMMPSPGGSLTEKVPREPIKYEDPTRSDSHILQLPPREEAKETKGGKSAVRRTCGEILMHSSSQGFEIAEKTEGSHRLQGLSGEKILSYVMKRVSAPPPSFSWASGSWKEPPQQQQHYDVASLCSMGRMSLDSSSEGLSSRHQRGSTCTSSSSTNSNRSTACRTCVLPPPRIVAPCGEQKDSSSWEGSTNSTIKPTRLDVSSFPFSSYFPFSRSPVIKMVDMHVLFSIFPRLPPSVFPRRHTFPASHSHYCGSRDEEGMWGKGSWDSCRGTSAHCGGINVAKVPVRLVCLTESTHRRHKVPPFSSFLLPPSDKTRTGRTPSTALFCPSPSSLLPSSSVSSFLSFSMISPLLSCHPREGYDPLNPFSFLLPHPSMKVSDPRSDLAISTSGTLVGKERGKRKSGGGEAMKRREGGETSLPQGCIVIVLRSLPALPAHCLTDSSGCCSPSSLRASPATLSSVLYPSLISSASSPSYKSTATPTSSSSSSSTTSKTNNMNNNNILFSYRSTAMRDRFSAEEDQPGKKSGVLPERHSSQSMRREREETIHRSCLEMRSPEDTKHKNTLHEGNEVKLSDEFACSGARECGMRSAHVRYSNSNMTTPTIRRSARHRSTNGTFSKSSSTRSNSTGPSSSTSSSGRFATTTTRSSSCKNSSATLRAGRHYAPLCTAGTVIPASNGTTNTPSAMASRSSSYSSSSFIRRDAACSPFNGQRCHRWLRKIFKAYGDVPFLSVIDVVLKEEGEKENENDRESNHHHHHHQDHAAVASGHTRSSSNSRRSTGKVDGVWNPVREDQAHIGKKEKRGEVAPLSSSLPASTITTSSTTTSTSRESRHKPKVSFVPLGKEEGANGDGSNNRVEGREDRRHGETKRRDPSRSVSHCSISHSHHSSHVEAIHPTHTSATNMYWISLAAIMEDMDSLQKMLKHYGFQYTRYGDLPMEWPGGRGSSLPFQQPKIHRSSSSCTISTTEELSSEVDEHVRDLVANIMEYDEERNQNEITMA